MSVKVRQKQRLSIGLVVCLIASFVVLMSLFPGRQFGLAFTIATGIGHGTLQERIDNLEDKAIQKRKFTEEDRNFLVDFYSALATGAKLTVAVRQTGNMMNHYLSSSGTPFQLEPEIFTRNRKVQAQVQLLRRRASRESCHSGQRYSSDIFYMPDSSNVDSVFGLYYGTLHLTQSVTEGGDCRAHWRAEVPWVWPSYSALRAKYGTPHAESFPLPSLKSLVLGMQNALFVDNGLGHHLEEIGAAKSFVAFAEWSDQ